LPKRLEKVGDLTAGMWRRKVSLLPRFEQLGLSPGDTSIGEPKPNSRARRWVSDQRS
jgi:hypothetical protein